MSKSKHSIILPEMLCTPIEKLDSPPNTDFDNEIYVSYAGICTCKNGCWLKDNLHCTKQVYKKSLVGQKTFNV